MLQSIFFLFLYSHRNSHDVMWWINKWSIVISNIGNVSILNLVSNENSPLTTFFFFLFSCIRRLHILLLIWDYRLLSRCFLSFKTYFFIYFRIRFFKKSIYDTAFYFFPAKPSLIHTSIPPSFQLNVFLFV